MFLLLFGLAVVVTLATPVGSLFSTRVSRGSAATETSSSNATVRRALRARVRRPEPVRATSRRGPRAGIRGTCCRRRLRSGGHPGRISGRAQVELRIRPRRRAPVRRLHRVRLPEPHPVTGHRELRAVDALRPLGIASSRHPRCICATSSPPSLPRPRSRGGAIAEAGDDIS